MPRRAAAARAKPAPRPRTPRRSGAVLVLLTPEERGRMRAVASAAGMPLGTWLRVLGLAASAPFGTQPIP